MTDLQRAVVRELTDIRMAVGRIEAVVPEDIPAKQLAHAVVALGAVNTALGAVMERLKVQVVARPELPAW
jgi:hypothetical protein